MTICSAPSVALGAQSPVPTPPDIAARTDKALRGPAPILDGKHGTPELPDPGLDPVTQKLSDEKLARSKRKWRLDPADRAALPQEDHSVSPTGIDPGPPLPSEANVGLYQQTQINGSYCGPSTMHSALGVYGIWREQTLLGRNLLTYLFGNTAWYGVDVYYVDSSGNVPSGLNPAWSEPSYHTNRPMPDVINYYMWNWRRAERFYAQPVGFPTSAAIADFSWRAKSDLASGDPVIANLNYEFGQQRLPTHTSAADKAQHFYMVHGYRLNGQLMMYTDPAYGSASWATARYGETTATVHIGAMRDRGFVW